MILYGLSCPSFILFSYKISDNKSKVIGRIAKKGSICRSLVVDDEGNVYGSFEKNRIFKFNYRTNKIQHLSTKLIKNENEIKEWKGEFRKGANFIGRNLWRSVVWDESNQLIYGIDSKSSQLFEFNSKNGNIRNICFFGKSEFRKKLDDLYPTLSMGIYENKIFYAPAGGLFDYSRSKNIKSSSSLVVYDLVKKSKKYFGTMRSGDRKIFGVSGIIINKKGILYMLGAIEVFDRHAYNALSIIGGSQFELSLIEIDTNKLNYGK